MRWLPILLMVPLLAGCALDGVEQPTYEVSGSFTAERTNADLQHFDHLVEKYEGQAIIREIYPEQFTVTLTQTNCHFFTQELEDQTYVAQVGACQLLERPG